jgi:phosphatidate cytidylyltransferase
MKRVFTSLVLIPVALYLTLWASPVVLLAAVVLVSFGCYHEYRGLAAAYGLATFRPVGYAAGLALLLAPPDFALFCLLVLLTLAAMSVALASGELRTALPRASVMTVGVLYTFGAWKFAPSLHAISPYWLLFALVLNWAGDIAAYYFGRTFGRRKLAPSISPGKTWEGAIASLITAAVFGWFYITRLLPHVNPLYAVPIALAGNAAGQIGDLAESAIKRGAGVKDSGSLLPGHGGLLDRLDSTIFTLPVVYVLARWL